MNQSTSEFLRRVLIVLGLGALAVVLYQLFHAIFGIALIIFGGVLLAVLIDGVARWLHGHTPLSRKVAVGVVWLVAIALFAAGSWFLGPRIAEQGQALSERLPGMFGALKRWLSEFAWGAPIAQQMPDSLSGLMADDVSVGAVTAVFSTVFGALPNLFIILFVGVYVSINPLLYVRGILTLVPKAHRPRANEVASALGNGLRMWLVGRIASMTVVGVLTAVALLLFGIPLALTLGLIAALLSFVPYFGPIMAFVPALAVALGEGSHAIATVSAIYVGVQFAESYLITPFIQKRTISMPPALLITGQVVLGVLAGTVGVAVATPLVVMVAILVQMLYVQDVLGDDVTVMGAKDKEAAA